MLTVIFLLVILPILLWPKTIAIAVIIVLLVRAVFVWGNAQNQILLFNPETDYWQLDGAEEYQELRLNPISLLPQGWLLCTLKRLRDQSSNASLLAM